MTQALLDYCDHVLGQVNQIVTLFRRYMPAQDEYLEIKRIVSCRPDSSRTSIIASSQSDGSISIRVIPAAPPLAPPMAIQAKLAALGDAINKAFQVRTSQVGQAGGLDTAMSVVFKLPKQLPLANHPYAQMVLDQAAQLPLEKLWVPTAKNRGFLGLERRFRYQPPDEEVVGSTLSVQAVAADRVRYTLLVQLPKPCIPAYDEIIRLAPLYCTGLLVSHSISPGVVCWDIQF